MDQDQTRMNKHILQLSVDIFAICTFDPLIFNERFLSLQEMI